MPSRSIESRKSRMAAVQTEAAITFERLEISMRFQLLPTIFDQIRLGYDTVDIVRHIQTSAAYRTQNDGHGNRKWIWLLTGACDTIPTATTTFATMLVAGRIPNTPDIARRRSTTDNQDGGYLNRKYTHYRAAESQLLIFTFQFYRRHETLTVNECRRRL